MKNPAIYIVTNRKDGTLYTGVTSDLAKRIEQHKSKSVRGFAAKYNCDKLVYFECHSTMENAIAREKQIKSGSRIKKIELINRFNQDWKDLCDMIG